MERIAERLALLKAFPDELPVRGAVNRREEFFKVQWPKLEAKFFRRNDDVCNVALETDERSCFDVVISTVFDEMLDELPGLREELYFVEDDAALALMKPRSVKVRQACEEVVEVMGIVLKELLHDRRQKRKVNVDEGTVFVLRERFGEEALAYPSRSFNQKGGAPLVGLLPFEEVLIGFSDEQHDGSLQFVVRFFRCLNKMETGLKTRSRGLKLSISARNRTI